MSTLVLRCAACGQVIAADEKWEKLHEYRALHFRATKHRALIMTAFMADQLDWIAPLIPREEQTDHAPTA